MTDEDRQDKEQPLLEHLVELRTRMLKGLAAVVLILACLLPFAHQLYAAVAAPLMAALPEGATMIATEVASPFFAPIKLSVFLAIFLAMPVLLYQAWAFVAPALFRHERQLAMPLLISSGVLFYAGCAFAYFVVMPIAFHFLTAMTPVGVLMMTDINAYLDFVLVMFLAFGLCFEIPVAVVILSTLGWVSPEQLATNRGYVLVGAFFLGAVLTPPDPGSQLLLALPMWLLFEVGLLAARWLRKRSPASEA